MSARVTRPEDSRRLDLSCDWCGREVSFRLPSHVEHALNYRPANERPGPAIKPPREEYLAGWSTMPLRETIDDSGAPVAACPDHFAHFDAHAAAVAEWDRKLRAMLDRLDRSFQRSQARWFAANPPPKVAR